jgi:hypothetical protein
MTQHNIIIIFVPIFAMRERKKQFTILLYNFEVKNMAFPNAKTSLYLAKVISSLSVDTFSHVLKKKKLS